MLRERKLFQKVEPVSKQGCEHKHKPTQSLSNSDDPTGQVELAIM